MCAYCVGVRRTVVQLRKKQSFISLQVTLASMHHLFAWSTAKAVVRLGDGHCGTQIPNVCIAMEKSG